MILIAAATLLTACSTGGGRIPGSTAGNGYGSYMQQTVEAAICAGRADDIARQLASEPLAAPADRFYLAFALEESGHPTKARALYAELMQTGHDGYVRIRCGNTVMVDGSLSEEAARRLAMVARNLAVLDADLRPTPRLHEGLLPSTSNTAGNNSNGTANSYNGPPVDVTRPSSQSPFGQWFAHLASYRSLESATKNKGTLEAKFPALQGIIDQWETVAGGNKAIRLGIRVRDKSDAVSLCQAVKSQGEYCAVIDTAL